MPKDIPDLLELKRVAAMMGVVELEEVITSIGGDDELHTARLIEKFQDQVCQRIINNFINKDFLSGMYIDFPLINLLTKQINADRSGSFAECMQVLDTWPGRHHEIPLAVASHVSKAGDCRSERGGRSRRREVVELS